MPQILPPRRGWVTGRESCSRPPPGLGGAGACQHIWWQKFGASLCHQGMMLSWHRGFVFGEGWGRRKVAAPQPEQGEPLPRLDAAVLAGSIQQLSPV